MSRDRQINFRTSPAEKEAYVAAAERARLPLSDWMRMVLLAASGDEELVRALRRARREDERLREALGS